MGITPKILCRVRHRGNRATPNFPLGMRGKVVGKFDTPINYEILFQDWIRNWTAEQLADGKAEDDLNSRRAFELSRPVTT